MKTIELIIVALVVLGALLYLYRAFKPKSGSGGGCGCGTVDCKVPKARIVKKDEATKQTPRPGPLGRG